MTDAISQDTAVLESWIANVSADTKKGIALTVYDIHGNVDTLLQDYRLGMGQIACSGDTANRFKKILYSYDLISGEVNDVAYHSVLLTNIAITTIMTLGTD